MTTSYFVYMNGYELQIPENAPEFARDLANRTVDDPRHTPSLEVMRIAEWLKDNLSHSVLARLQYVAAAQRVERLGYRGDILYEPRLIWGTNPIWAKLGLRRTSRSEWLWRTLKTFSGLLRQ